jgi:diamine N-acetyltransferase
MTDATPTLVIRRATAADAEHVRELTMRTFGETFAHLYPPEDLAAFFRDAYSRDGFERLLADDQHALWLLESNGEAIGHALAGPCGLPHRDAAPGDGEIKRLYILRDHHNGGWGAKFMQTALDWLERDGPRTLWVGVWSQNTGAQRFYGRYGFEMAGEYEFPVGKTRDREFILRRPAGELDSVKRLTSIARMQDGGPAVGN